MMRPLGLYLAEFRTGTAAPPPGALALVPDAGAAVAFPAMDVPELDAPVLEAEAFPALAGPAPMLALEAPVEPGPDLVAALAAQAAEHEAALATARARWAAEEGAALAERIGQAFAELEARLAAALVPLLEPFLGKAAQAKALGQLHDTLATLLDGGDARPVTVSGPADLVAALRDRVGDRPGLDYSETEGPDVAIALGDTRIRSQLRAWTRKLDLALEAGA